MPNRPLTDPLTDTPKTDVADEAMRRFAVLRPHIEDDIPLAEAARLAAVPVRTARRWLARFEAEGLQGLTRCTRSDQGHRKFPEPLVSAVEGLALCGPRPSIAAIHRKLTRIAGEHAWPVPSYGTVYAIVRSLDPGMVTLAQEGAGAYRDRFELIHRHRAQAPNALWQADHTMLDVSIVDANGTAQRPWLTIIMDDYSRAVTGYFVFLGAPSALHTSLALRQAIWCKQVGHWPVCGIPDILYVDHGCDFTSKHLERAAAEMRMQLIHSTVARPQGRGKIERFFGTLNTELLPELPGHLCAGKAVTIPKLSLSELDEAIRSWITETYNTRTHSETGTAPVAAWQRAGWIPRMPDTLETLDELLVMVAKPRKVRRDGVRFQGLRFISPILAPYVGETVTLRYDPRDLCEIRIFLRDRFLCRAVSPEHDLEHVTLKDIQTARSAQRRALRGKIRARAATVAEFLPEKKRRKDASPETSATKPKRKLRIYSEGD